MKEVLVTKESIIRDLFIVYRGNSFDLKSSTIGDILSKHKDLFSDGEIEDLKKIYNLLAEKESKNTDNIRRLLNLLSK